jgi:hypothetical protein
MAGSSSASGGESQTSEAAEHVRRFSYASVMGGGHPQVRFRLTAKTQRGKGRNGGEIKASGGEWCVSSRRRQRGAGRLHCELRVGEDGRLHKFCRKAAKATKGGIGLICIASPGSAGLWPAYLAATCHKTHLHRKSPPASRPPNPDTLISPRLPISPPLCCSAALAALR